MSNGEYDTCRVCEGEVTRDESGAFICDCAGGPVEPAKSGVERYVVFIGSGLMVLDEKGDVAVFGSAEEARRCSRNLPLVQAKGAYILCVEDGEFV